MSLASEAIKGLIGLIKALPEIQAKERQQIITVIGELQDELDRSTDLTIFYLEGAYRIHNNNELSDYLSDMGMKLLNKFNEFKVCAGLYITRDKFNSIIDPLKYSLNALNLSKIDELLNGLAGGEKMVLEYMRDLVSHMQEQANALRNSDEDRELVIQTIKIEVETLKAQMIAMRKQIKDLLVAI